MSARTVAAYRREPTSNERATELIDQGDRSYAALRYAEAERAYREALNTLDPQKDAESRGQVFLSIGGALRLQGRAAEAEQPLREALAIFTRHDGADSLRAALVMQELAKAKCKQDLLVPAEETALHAYHVFEHILGPADPLSLLALRTAVEILDRQLNSVAIVELIQPRIDKIDGQSSLASESLRAYFDTLLGSALVHVRRDKDGELYLRKAIVHLARTTPAAGKDIAENELQLGEALIHQGRLAEAQTYIISATHFFTTLGDPNKIGSSAYEFGKLYAAQGDYASAIKSYDDALAAYARARRPAGDTIMHRVRIMKALSLCKVGQCAQGEELARSAFVAVRSAEREDHDAADITEGFGVVLQSRQKYAQAAQAFDRAASVSEKLSVPVSKLVSLRIAQGMALYGAGKMSDAESVFKKLIDEAAAANLPRDETVANAKEWLGEILYSVGKIEEAERYLLAAGDDYVALQSSHGHDVLAAFFCALVGYSKRRPDIAERMLQIVLPMFDGPKHPGALVLGEHLHSLVLRERGRTGEALKSQQRVTELCAGKQAATAQACAIIKRPGWVAHCPPCSPTRASSIEILRAIDAFDISITAI
jgi:tetratricopeptide (TPR) repeat protein